MLTLSLAVKDWLYERTLTVCAILALAGMLTPILVIDGVRNGVITGMRERLLQDPMVLVISPYAGKETYSKAFLEELRIHPATRFVIGKTRAIANDISVRSHVAQLPLHTEPAASGEPVLVQANVPAPKDGNVPELVLSHHSAQSLGVQVGETVTALLGRKTPEGKRESWELAMTVSGILPPSVSDRSLGFLPLSLLEDIQDYRDFVAVPNRKTSGVKRTAPREYESFRLYAKDLDAVEELARYLAEKGVNVRTKAHEIAQIRGIDWALQRVIMLLGIAVAIGFGAFLMSSAKGAVARKLRMLGLLRLFGVSRWALMSYPLVQIALTSLAGLVLSGTAYAIVAYAIDALFFEQSGGLALCRLGIADFCVAALVVFGFAGLTALYASLRAAAVDPAAVIREQ